MPDNLINPDGTAAQNLGKLPYAKDISTANSIPIYTYYPEDSKYDENYIPGSLDPFANYQALQEHRAQQQSVGNRWASVVPRLVLTTGTKLGSGLGYIGGGIGALIEGAGGATTEEAMDTMLNNAWVKFFENSEETVKNNWFPIYKTKNYLNGNIWQQMGSASFWTDDVVDGLAFMASTFIPGVGLSKLGTGAKIASGFANGLKAAKLGKYVPAALNIQKLAKGLDWVGTTALATTAEAGFEAKDSWNQTFEALKEIDPLTGQPTGKFKLANGKYISEQEAKHIAAETAADVYRGNVIALAASNAFEAANFLGTFAGARKVIRGLDNKIIPLTTKQKIGKFVKGALATAATEGPYEENIQLAMQNYYRDEGIEKIKNKGVENIFFNMLDNFTTDEGQKNIVMGSLIGLIPGGIGKMHEAISSNERAASLQKAINDSHAFYYPRKADVYKQNKDGSVYVNENGKPELDSEKIAKNWRAFKGIARRDELKQLALQNDSEEIFSYLQDRELASSLYNYLQTDEGLELFDNTIDSVSQEDLENENSIRKSLSLEELSVDDLIKSRKVKAREFKKIYDSINDRDVFLAKLKNDKVGNNLREELRFGLYTEAVNQVAIKNALGKVNGKINELTAKNTEEVLKKNDEYAELIAVQKELNDSLSQSEQNYAIYASPKERMALRKAKEQAEIDLDTKRKNIEYTKKETVFKEEVRNNITEDALDDNNNYPKRNDLIASAKKKGIKNPEAIIDNEIKLAAQRKIEKAGSTSTQTEQANPPIENKDIITQQEDNTIPIPEVKAEPRKLNNKEVIALVSGKLGKEASNFSGNLMYSPDAKYNPTWGKNAHYQMLNKALTEKNEDTIIKIAEGVAIARYSLPNDDLFKYLSNKILEYYGYDAKEVVNDEIDTASESAQHSSFSTGEFADNDLDVDHTISSIDAETRNIDEVISMDGDINLYLSDFAILPNKSSSDLLLDKEDTDKYNILKNLTSGTELHILVDESRIEDNKSKDDPDLVLDEKTLPIKVVIPGQKAKFNLNRIVYLERELKLTDILLLRAKDNWGLFQNFIKILTTEKHVGNEWAKLLYEYFGEDGKFTTKSQVSLYDKSFIAQNGEIRPVLSEEQTIAVTRDVKHLRKLFDRNLLGRKATSQDDFDKVLSAWKNRVSSDLNNSLEIRKTLWSKYQNNDKTPIAMPVARITHGSFNHLYNENNKPILRKVSEIFGTEKDLNDRINNYKLATVHLINTDKTAELYDVNSASDEKAIPIFIDKNKSMNFKPGQIYLITNETMNGTEFPILLEHDVLKKDSPEFPKILKLVHDIILLMHGNKREQKAATLKDIRNNGLIKQLRQYINVVTAYNAKSIEFRVWGDSYDPTSKEAPKRVLSLIDKEGNEYNIFTRNEDGTFVNRNEDGTVINEDGRDWRIYKKDKDGQISEVDSTLVDLLEGKFKNVDISQFKQDPAYKHQVLEGNDKMSPALLTSIAKVVDDQGNKIGVAQVSGRYPLTISISTNGKTEKRTEPIDASTKPDIPVASTSNIIDSKDIEDDDIDDLDDEENLRGQNTGLLQSLPINVYNEQYLYDYFNVGHSTKNGTEIPIEKVVSFVEQFGSDLDNEFFSLLNSATKGLKVIVDNRESDENDKVTISYYNPKTKTFGINFDYFTRGERPMFKSELAHAFSHENIHLITLRALEESKTFADEITEYFTIAKEKIGDKFPNVTNIKEFIAEAISNPIYISALENIQYKEQNTSIWSKIVASIKRILNFILGYSTETNLFDKTLKSLRNELKTNSIRIKTVGDEIALEGSVTNDYDESDQKFSAEEKRLAVNWLLANTQKIIIKSEQVSKQDILDKKENDLRQQLVDRANIRLQKVKIKIAENPSKQIYKDIENFWIRVIDNLHNNKTDTGLYNRVKSEYEYIYNVEIEDYDSLNDLLKEHDENRASLTRTWDEASAYGRSTSSTYEPLTRYAIATLEEARYDKSGNVVKKTNKITGSTEYVNYSAYKNKLQAVLAGSTSEEEVFYKLNDIVRYFPSIKFLIDKLQKDGDTKQAFLSDMMKVFPQKVIYNINLQPNGDLDAEYRIENKAHKYDIADKWINQIRHAIALGILDNNMVENVLLRINGDGDKILSLKTIFANDFDKGTEVLSGILRNLYININANYIKTHFHATQQERFKDTEDTITNINNTILDTEYISRIKRIIDNIKYNLKQTDTRKIVIGEYGTYNSLAETLSKYTMDFIEPSAPNIHGDIEWGFRLPTFIMKFYAEAKSDYSGTKAKFLQRLQEYAQTPEGKYSNLLWSVPNEGRKGFLKPVFLGVKENKSIYNYTPALATLDEDFIKNFEVNVFGGLKNRITGEGDDYGEMTDLDFRFSTLLQYLVRKDTDNGEYIRVPGIILSDSSQNLMYRVHKFYLAKDDIIDSTLDGFKIRQKSNIHTAINRIAMQEFGRIQQAIDTLYNKNDNNTYTIKSIEQLKAEGLYEHLLENQHYIVENGKPVFEKLNEKTGQLEPVGNLFKFYHIPTLNNSNGNILYNEKGMLKDNIFTLEGYKTFINEKIDAYIKELVKDAYNWYNYDEYKSFVKKNNNTLSFLNVIAEMALNHYIYYIEQQNFFNGGTYEFKDVLDSIKRAKAINSGGKSNSTNGVSKVAIVNDDIMASKLIDGYEDLARKELKKRGVSETHPEFKKQLDNILKDYRKITITDGQGFITENTWIKRQIEAGHGKDIISIIESYNSKFGQKYRFKENLKLEDFVVVPQVDKPFISARRFDSKLNRMTRLQLKLSEAILFRDTVKDTQLEQIADWMDDNDVDEFLFGGSRKEGITPMISISTSGELNSDTKFGNITTFYYNNADRYSQLDVPDAILDEHNKFGIQIRKHILSNINPEYTYFSNGELSGAEIIEEFNNLISENIIESLNKLHSEILAKDSNLDKKKIAQVLVEQFNARNRSANAKDFVRYNETENKFEMNLSFNGHRKAIISTLTSLYTNNVTAQKFPGGHVVLMSDVFSGIRDDKKAFYGEQAAIENGIIKPMPKRLTVTSQNVNGLDTLVAECRLPAYSKKFFRNGNTININELPDELKTFIGYRIPTSGKHSAIILKVVEFLPRTAGSLIVVADDIVARMNSDFDVDSLFLMMPSFNANKLSDKTVEGIRTNLDLIINGLSASRILDKVKILEDTKATEDAKVNALIEKIEYVLSKDDNDLKASDIEFLDVIERTFVERFSSKDAINTLPDGLRLSYVYDKYNKETNNTTQSRNNRILELMLAILGSEHHLIEGINPANYNTNKWLTSDKNNPDSLMNLIEEEQENYNPVSIVSQLRIRRKAVNGKNVLPIAATWATGVTVLQNLKAQIERTTREDGSIDMFAGVPIKYDIRSIVNNLKDSNLNTSAKIEAKINNLYESLKTKLKSKYDSKDIIDDKDNKIITVIKRNIGWNKDGTFWNEEGSLFTDLIGEDVDNAADTLKGNLPCNLNDYTYNIWAMLKAIVGDTNYAGYFINQPIVRELFRNYKLTQGILENDRRDETHETIKQWQTKLFKALVKADKILLYEKEQSKLSKDPNYTVKKKYNDFADTLALRIKQTGDVWFRVIEKDKFTSLINDAIASYNIKYSPDNTVILDSNDLINQIKAGELDKKSKLENEEEIKFIITQLQILNVWGKYNVNAKNISNTIRVTNVDKLGASPTFRVTENMQDNIDKALRNNIISAENDKTIAENIFYLGKYKMLSTFWENGNLTSYEKLTPLFLTQSSVFASVINKFRDDYGYYLGDRIDYAISKLEDYLINNLLTEHPLFNVDDDTKNRILGIGQSPGILSTAEKLENLKTKLNLKPDAVHILNVLDGDISPIVYKRDGFRPINVKLIRKDPFIDDEIVQSVKEMYFKGTPEEKDLIKELIQYNFIVSKLSYGKNSFVQFIPLAIWKDLGIAALLENKEQNINNSTSSEANVSSIFSNDVLNQFILENSHLDYMVPRVAPQWEDIMGGITKNGTPSWNIDRDGNIIVAKSALNRVENNFVKSSKFIKKHYKGNNEERGYFVVYQRTLLDNVDDERYAAYVPILRYVAGNTLVKNKLSSIYTNSLNENISTNNTTNDKPYTANLKDIYENLGNTTRSNFSGASGAGVKIVGNPNNYLNEQKQGNAVVAYAGASLPQSFENPFHHNTNVSTKSNVISFIDFVINSNDPQAKWIREQLKSGKFKNKPIYYGNTRANKANEPSHATALDYMINVMNWNNQITTKENVDLFTTKERYRGITKVISGGQTGVDITGLDVAKRLSKELNIEYGGTAAAYFMQSIAKGVNVKNPNLAQEYNLKEGKITSKSGSRGSYEDPYHQRTIDNAQEADGTIWFGNTESPGGKLTLGKTAQRDKPDPLVNPTSAEQINEWLNANKIKIVNIAGNREWTNLGISATAQKLLEEAFRLNKSLRNLLSSTELMNYDQMTDEEKHNFLNCL